jgi:hypothetical protein
VFLLRGIMSVVLLIDVAEARDLKIEVMQSAKVSLTINLKTAPPNLSD